MKAFLIVISIANVFCFNYENEGPETWPIEIPQCAGKTQSPININDWESKYDPSLTQFNFFHYNDNLTWNCTHNGHTVIFLPIVNGTNTLKFVTDSLVELFTISQFHFHWGENDYQGSEHYIDGNKYPAELHLVHKSFSNKLAVLGFFLALSDDDTDNVFLNNLINGITSAYNSSDTITLQLKMNDIIPDLVRSGSYYRYNGSLTTPPCTENIIWTVFETPIRLSKRQLSAFHNNSIHKNFRNLQRLYKRVVYSNRNIRRDNPDGIQNNNYAFSIKEFKLSFIFYLILILNTLNSIL